MQKTDYIIRRRGGDLWHFFHSDKEGLCLRKKQNNKWGEHEILLDNAFFDFSVLCDGDDNTHMVCQDTDGSILYLAHHHDQWHKFTLLKSKTQNAYAKHFKLILTGSQLQLFYTIHSANRLLLFHQLLGSEEEPTVVDAVRDSLRPFFVVCDDYLNAWIYYQSTDGVLGCRQYRWSAKQFEDFLPTPETGADCPFVHMDSFGRHHIIAIQKGCLIYLRRGTDGRFHQKKLIHTASEGTPLYLPIILGDFTKMWLMWQQGNVVYYSTSTDDGGEWSRAMRFMSTGIPPQLFSFQKEEAASYCWGYIANGDIHLFAAEQESKPSTGAKIQREGQAVEEFAKRHAGDFGKMHPISVQAEPDGIELKKLKILISGLGEQVSMQKRNIELLNAKIAQLEQKIGNSENAANE